jgi:hypothetical protein
MKELLTNVEQLAQSELTMKTGVLWKPGLVPHFPSQISHNLTWGSSRFVVTKNEFPKHSKSDICVDLSITYEIFIRLIKAAYYCYYYYYYNHYHQHHHQWLCSPLPRLGLFSVS